LGIQSSKFIRALTPLKVQNSKFKMKNNFLGIQSSKFIRALTPLSPYISSVEQIQNAKKQVFSLKFLSILLAEKLSRSTIQTEQQHPNFEF
jgi:hypothetical protein